MDRLQNFLHAADERGLKVLVTGSQFDRYTLDHGPNGSGADGETHGTVVGEAGVPVSAMQDYWSESSVMEAKPARELIESRLVVWYFLAALTFLFVSMLGGILMALQLVNWNPLRGIEWLSPGRWRMVHTNAVAYGFLANAFLGCLHWAVPRLTLKPVLSRPLSYFIFFAWQFVLLVTAVGILAGYAQGVEWGETPTWIDPLALLGPRLQRRGIPYLSAAHGFEYWLSLAPGTHSLMRRATSIDLARLYPVPTGSMNTRSV
jgi:hypothetical protein